MSTDLTFLVGGGEVGSMMRAKDWGDSPLGPPERWPQSLRSIVGLMLNSKFPMFVAWGDELGFLYNDAYVDVLGDKHPDALGGRFHDIWGEIWTDLLPLIDAALAGEAIYRENLPLVMNRKGFEEQTWFTFSYSPVRHENGRVAGMFCACTETTAQVLGARRRTALLELDDKIRDVTETADLSFVASELIGRTLGAARVGYGVLDMNARTVTVERNWSAPGFSDVAGVHQFRDYGTYIDELIRGEPVANCDIANDTRSRDKISSFQALGIGAHLDVPVVENGLGVAEIFVHSAAPRVWSEDEIALVREIAERTHAAIARRAAEQERRESEARFRSVFDSEIIGLTIFDTVTQQTDSINDHFLRMTGHTRADYDEGRWNWRDFTPAECLSLDQAAIAQAQERGWWDPYEKEYRHRDGHRFPVRISSAPMPGYPGKVVVSVENISDQKRWEQHQRLLVGELNHRVKNSLAIVQSVAHQTFPKTEAIMPFVAKFEARLAGLAATHNLLTRANWASADLQTLITDGLSLHTNDDHRIVIRGEPLAVAPQPAVSLAMAVHELATNAVKYGSLSNDSGKVDVSWSANGDGFLFEWQESGGPVVQTPNHRGFGSRMIERALSSALGGEAALVFDAGGLSCRITAPATILA